MGGGAGDSCGRLGFDCIGHLRRVCLKRRGVEGVNLEKVIHGSEKKTPGIKNTIQGRLLTMRCGEEMQLTEGERFTTKLQVTLIL